MIDVECKVKTYEGLGDVPGRVVRVESESGYGDRVWFTTPNGERFCVHGHDITTAVQNALRTR